MKRVVAFSVILIFFLSLPLFIESRFWLGFWTTTLFFALLGQSWNILGGYGGQVSFGHAGFFGTGAYVSAVLQVRLGLDAWTSAALAVAAGAPGGAVLWGVRFPLWVRGACFAPLPPALARGC